jgi:hypothetical protein
MIIYLAGAEGNQKALAQAKIKNLLMSYYSLKDKPLDKYDLTGKSVFLDSGGFVARTKGVEISVEDYARYILKNKDHITVCANLDTNSLEQSKENYQYLKSQLKGMVKVLPVYHPNEPLSYLEDMLKDTNHIAMGGIAGLTKSRRYVETYISNVFIRTKDKIKVHGFGITKIDYLLKYPFYSVDSTTWLSGARYGQVCKFINGRIKKSQSVKRQKEVKDIMIFGDYKQQTLYNAIAFLEFQDYLTELWSKRGINWEE